MGYPDIVLGLPDWVHDIVPCGALTSEEDRMSFVIKLAILNVQNKTGGPFGAAIFEKDSGRLIAPGVNIVVPSKCSTAHAEIMSICIAQRTIGTYDLGGAGFPSYEILSSTEPCTMCMGAILWSGVRQLTYGSRSEDAQKYGFDEGPKPADWVGIFESKGISVAQDVLRTEACAVLSEYHKKGGLIYNARQG